MTQHNQNGDGCGYAELSAQYGNLYAVGYAVAEGEAKNAMSRLVASLRSAMARRTGSRSSHETGMAPARRRAAAKP